MVPRSRNLLLIFAKYPQAGLVKTRLGRRIGLERAAQLYRAFLIDLALRFAEQEGITRYDIRWVYVPSGSRFPELIWGIQGTRVFPGQVSFAAYEEAGLLQQQIEQFDWAYLHGYRHVVGISTDTPHLPRRHVVDAFDKLEDFDVVIGPTYDGGYYLLGSHPHTLIQRDVEMGTDHVVRDMLAVAAKLNLKICLLPPMLDIDEEQDLVTFANSIEQADCSTCPATWKVLKEMATGRDG